RRAPTAPESAVFPVDGSEVEGTQFTFKWTPATDVDGGEIVESHFQLSPQKDMAYVLSPNFEKLTSRTGDRTGAVCVYRIPYEGLLNPEETYYWRVRARNDAGIWGDWSSVWQFTPQGPGIPLDVAVKVDRKSRCGTLSWRANPRGRTPVRYLVYGSNEQGFTASDDPYLVTVAKGKQETFSANLMVSTETTELDVIGPDLDLKDANSGFYRVAAVDEQGVRSGVSDLATVSRPWICSRPETLAKVGQNYVYQVEVVRSIGDLQTRVIDGNPYNPAFRNADELIFTLVDAPEWLRVDENGKITGCPKQMGRCEVTIRVTRRQGGQDKQVYMLDMKE
ncbi:MAG: hypothetical protein O7G87_03310, partial [bacterium]|nr:hypothetical protein [bacterium]